MTDGADNSRIAEVRLLVYRARARSAVYAAQAAQAAGSADLVRDQVEHMIERLADRHPQRAERLHAISSTAARQRDAAAARKREFYAARRAVGQVIPERPDEPGPGPLAALDVYLRDMAVVEERERIAQELMDQVVSRAFTAGLTLQGAAGLTTKPEVRQRIDDATADLDEVIRAIRNVVFNLS